MRELSLFSGAGGGLLGTYLLGWRPVGYVEWDEYCQRVIAARIKDGILPDAPIFGDVNAFNRDGYAAAYTGLVDVVTGGFPCQPFSLAGKRQGASDERNGWPATIECLRVVRPRWALLENVPGLLTSGYFGTILGDLAASGFDCRWRVLSAAEMGAPHKRDRLWIVAYPTGSKWRTDSTQRRSTRRSAISHGLGNDWQVSRMDVADTTSIQPRNGEQPAGTYVARHQSAQPVSEQSEVLAVPERQGLALGDRQTGERSQPAITGGDWWAVEPDVGRVASGVASRLDRLKALGNGQVPAVVRAAWLLMTD